MKQLSHYEIVGIKDNARINMIGMDGQIVATIVAPYRLKDNTEVKTFSKFPYFFHVYVEDGWGQETF